MNKFFLSFFLITTSSFAVDMPDTIKTPGDVLPYTKEQVCAGVKRLPVTSVIRKKSYANYGLTGNHTGYCAVHRGCELDHLVPVLIGGSNSVKNLWPQQPYSGKLNAIMKDRLEIKLKKLVCSGKIELKTAQKEVAENWVDSYTKHVK